MLLSRSHWPGVYIKKTDKSDICTRTCTKKEREWKKKSKINFKLCLFLRLLALTLLKQNWKNGRKIKVSWRHFPNLSLNVHLMSYSCCAQCYTGVHVYVCDVSRQSIHLWIIERQRKCVLRWNGSVRQDISIFALLSLQLVKSNCLNNLSPCL